MPVSRDALPRFDELPGTADAPPRSAWGLFGDDDEIGTLNLIAPDDVVTACRQVTRGAVFALNWDLELPEPAVLGRGAIKHRMVRLRTGWDDAYDDFYTQSSTQWDGLMHVGHPRYGYYNGRSEEDLTAGALGIEKWARRGIAGRFLLLDVARYRESVGAPIDNASSDRVTVGELEHVIAKQGSPPRPGDILLLRFGWIAWYEQLDGVGRSGLSEAGPPGWFSAPGLAAEVETARWLWDHRFAAVAADCPAVEALPFDDADEDGFLHYRLIPLLGAALGELFALDALAADCAQTGVYHGLFTSAPLNKRGGAGSPANALAIK